MIGTTRFVSDVDAATLVLVDVCLVDEDTACTVAGAEPAEAPLCVAAASGSAGATLTA